MEPEINLKNIKMGAVNVFNIVEPDYYDCRVIKYVPSHSILVIQCIHRLNSDNKHLKFENVDYFEGPMLWSGASFNTGTLTEYRELKYKLMSEIALEHITLTNFQFSENQAEKLFVVKLPNLQVRIIASAVEFTEPLV